MFDDNCLIHDCNKHSQPKALGSIKIIPHLETYQKKHFCGIFREQ